MNPQGEAFGVPKAGLWPDHEAFIAYLADAVGRLVVGDEARSLADAVLHPSVTAPVRPASVLLAFVTVGLLPAPLREGYGLAWSDARGRAPSPSPSASAERARRSPMSCGGGRMPVRPTRGWRRIRSRSPSSAGSLPVVASTTIRRGPSAAHLRAAKDLMDRDFARPLDLDALAREAFSSRFSDLVGMSPSDYRREAVARGGPPPIPGCFILMWTRPHDR